MNFTEKFLLWADKLRDISAMGSRFARNPYDKEHYAAVQEISIEMFAAATNTPIENLQAVRESVFTSPTPFSAGDAAIIDPDGFILLIRRVDNQLWAMPGGALEVGETPAEGVVREALEETGVRCRPIALVGVFDSRFCGTQSAHHLYHFEFLCTPLNGREIPTGKPSHAREVLDTAWFHERDLPADIDPGHVSRIAQAFRIWRSGSNAYFDN